MTRAISNVLQVLRLLQTTHEEKHNKQNYYKTKILAMHKFQKARIP